MSPVLFAPLIVPCVSLAVPTVSVSVSPALALAAPSVPVVESLALALAVPSVSVIESPALALAVPSVIESLLLLLLLLLAETPSVSVIEFEFEALSVAVSDALTVTLADPDAPSVPECESLLPPTSLSLSELLAFAPPPVGTLSVTDAPSVALPVWPP